MVHHIFQSKTELQNIPEAAPEASRSFSVSGIAFQPSGRTQAFRQHLRLKARSGRKDFLPHLIDRFHLRLTTIESILVAQFKYWGNGGRGCRCPRNFIWAAPE